mgnify:FL=1
MCKTGKILLDDASLSLQSALGIYRNATFWDPDEEAEEDAVTRAFQEAGITRDINKKVKKPAMPKKGEKR